MLSARGSVQWQTWTLHWQLRLRTSTLRRSIYSPTAGWLPLQSPLLKVNGITVHPGVQTKHLEWFLTLVPLTSTTAQVPLFGDPLFSPALQAAPLAVGAPFPSPTWPQAESPEPAPSSNQTHAVSSPCAFPPWLRSLGPPPSGLSKQSVVCLRMFAHVSLISF